MESTILSHSSSTCKTQALDSPNSSGGKSGLGFLTNKTHPLDINDTPSDSGSSSRHFSKEKHSQTLFRCLECTETFCHNLSLQKHYLETHTTPKLIEGTIFNCPNCKQNFPCSVTLKVHQQEHVLPNVQQFSSNRSHHPHNNPPRRLLSISFACHICDEGFNSRDLLVEHANGHLLGHVCNNETCQKLYSNQHQNRTIKTSQKPDSTLDSSKSKMSSHLPIISRREPRGENSAATKGPKVPTAAIRVRRNSSKNEPSVITVHGRKRFQCKICQKSLSSKLSHEEHFRGVHTNLKPYSCTVCAKSFAVKNTYRQHMAAHSLSIGSSPSNSGETDNHPSIRIRSINKCCVCGKTFPSSAMLDHHSCDGSSSNPNRVPVPGINNKRGELFRCKICGKVFSRREWRTKHYLSHGGESCFRCEICGDISINEQLYEIHAQVHFKKSLLDCPVCGKIFPGKDMYERHSCRFGVGSSG